VYTTHPHHLFPSHPSIVDAPVHEPPLPRFPFDASKVTTHVHDPLVIFIVDKTVASTEVSREDVSLEKDVQPSYPHARNLSPLPELFMVRSFVENNFYVS
jgi:hypothetical protein